MALQLNLEVFIAGYYGFGNTGDELILGAILGQLRERSPGVKITVMSGDPAHTATSFDVVSFDWRDTQAMLSAVERATLVVIGGGGLFHDYFGAAPDLLLTSSNYGLGLFAAIALVASLQRKPLLLWNVGVGPLTSPWGRQLTGYVARTAAVITVRDAGSRRLLEELDVDPAKITVASDPIFTLDAPATCTDRVRDLVGDFRAEGEPLIGVCLRNWEVGVDRDYWTRQVAQGLDRVVAATRARFVFVPFQIGEVSRENDAALAEQVASQMASRDRTRVLDQSLTPDETLQAMTQFDAVLGMRLHSVLLAALAGVPSVPLSYDPKVSNLVEDLGLDDYDLLLGSVTAAAVDRLLQQVLQHRNELSSSLRSACLVLREKASQTAGTAVALLHSEPSLTEAQPSESERLALTAIEALSKESAAAWALIRSAQQAVFPEGKATSPQSSLDALIYALRSDERAQESKAAHEQLLQQLSDTNAALQEAESRLAVVDDHLAEITELKKQLAAGEAALRSAHAAMRLVETVENRPQVDGAETQQTRSALAELRGWTEQQARHIQELASWTGKQSNHIELLERQLAALRRSEGIARERYEALARRSAMGPLQGLAQKLLDVAQAITPEGLRRAVRPIYLPIYFRLFPAGRAVPAAFALPRAAREAHPPTAPVRDLSAVPSLELDDSSQFTSYQPKISVVLPVWNHGKLLPLAVRSVLNQTWRNLELIIVDDGSDEDLAPALRDAIGHDDRVRVVRRPHAGLPQTLSAGFRFAQGELLTWTSADNLMKPEMLATLASFLYRRPDVDMTYGDMDLIDDAGSPLYHSNYRTPAQRPGATNELRLPRTVQALSLVNDNFIGAAFLYRAEIARVLADYDSSSLGTEDYDYWLRLGASGRIEHADCDRCLYRYRVHDDSLSGRHAPEIGANAVQLIDFHRGRLRYYRQPFHIAILSGDPADHALRQLTDALRIAGNTVTVIDAVGQKSERAAQNWLAEAERISPDSKLALVSDSPAPEWLGSLLGRTESRVALFFRVAEETVDLSAADRHPAWALCTSTRFVSQLPTPLAKSWSVMPRSAFEYDQLMISLRARDGIMLPWDLPGIREPLFVYIGPTDDAILDWDAVADLAKAYPEATILFISHAGRNAVDPRSRVSGPARIEFLGIKNPEEWRAYLSCAALLIAPLKDTPEVDEAVYDIMVPYLAAGKPILATEAILTTGFSDAPHTWIVPATAFAASASDAISVKPDLNLIDLYLGRKAPSAIAAEIAAVANERLFRGSDAEIALRPNYSPPPDSRRQSRPVILIETATFDKGGLERVVLEQAQELNRRGYRVSVAITGTGGAMAEQCRASGIPVHDIGPDANRFNRLLETESPDLLIPHYSNLGAPLAWRRGIPSLGFIHNSYIWTTEEQNRAIQDTDLYVTHYVAVSRTAARFFARKYFVNPEKITCIPNGTDTRGLRGPASPSLRRADLGLDAKDFVLINVASVFGTKAQIHAIAAVNALRQEIPRLRVLFVGGEADSSYGAAVRDFIREAGLSDIIQLCGQQQFVADYYGLADVFLMPSLIEGWSLAKTEAMFFGLPLILTDVGGAAEVICNGDIGALVPPAYDDPMEINAGNLWRYCTNRTPSNLDALVAAIRDAYRNRELWRAKGELAREKVLRCFTLEKITDRHCSEIERLLAQHGQRDSAPLSVVQRSQP